MKEMTFEEMEKVEAGWGWGGCAAGVAAAYGSGLLSYAAMGGGRLGLGAAAAASCAIGGFFD